LPQYREGAVSLNSTFDVPVDVFSDPNTARDFILPSELELLTDQRSIDRVLKGIDAENSLLDDAGKASARLQAAALQKLLDQKREFRENGLLYCKHTVYTISKPTYLQRIQAEEAARHFDTESGLATVDRVKVIRYLLRECIQSISKSDLTDLEPVVAEYLENKVNATLCQDRQILPF
jgi:hypothetical protein